jgi:hypothetical protein
MRIHSAQGARGGGLGCASAAVASSPTAMVEGSSLEGCAAAAVKWDSRETEMARCACAWRAIDAERKLLLRFKRRETAL